MNFIKRSKKISLQLYVNLCKKNYTKFMGIDIFPCFEMIPIQLLMNEVDKNGVGSFATQFYDTKTRKQTLEVWEDIYSLQCIAEYLLFHEFTHILDSEQYIHGDKRRNVGFKGYLEYHAAQIDFLRLLNVKSINQEFSFSVEQEIETVDGKQKAIDYVRKTHELARKLISKKEFPPDHKMLSTAIGIVFNYWGRRSICKMYAVDYREEIDNSVIINFLGQERFTGLNNLMNGWLDKNMIETVCDIYVNMIVYLATKYSL